MGVGDSDSDINYDDEDDVSFHKLLFSVLFSEIFDCALICWPQFA